MNAHPLAHVQSRGCYETRRDESPPGIDVCYDPRCVRCFGDAAKPCADTTCWDVHIKDAVCPVGFAHYGPCTVNGECVHKGWCHIHHKNHDE